MPNAGAGIIIALLIIQFIALPVAIGYWCARVYRRKNRSPETGFTIGVALMFFLSFIGAALAPLIAYLVRPVDPAAPRAQRSRRTPRMNRRARDAALAIRASREMHEADGLASPDHPERA
jgi:hypothetical protein